MIEIHVYKCEICGQTFDFEEDCRKHEMEHNIAKLKGTVVLMDSNGKILPLEDMHTAIEKSYAVYVGCKEAADILWELFEEDGYCNPIENIETSVQYPVFLIYNQDRYCWQNLRDLEEEYTRLLELKITAENALLH